MSFEEIQVRFPELPPSGHDAKELFVALNNLQDAIKEVAFHVDPDTHEDHIYWSLVEVKDGSSRYFFLPNVKQLVKASLLVFSCIQNNSYSNIPISSSEKVKEFHKYNQKKKLNCELYISDNLKAHLSYDYEIEVPQKYILKGDTTLYGELTRVGGAEPKARIKFIGGQTLSCTISKDNAQKIGKFLYKELELKGYATWSKETKRIIDFKIENFKIIERKNIVETFKKLREAGGNVWDDIENIEDELADD